MFCQLKGTHLILVILGIIVVLYLINYWLNSLNKQSPNQKLSTIFSQPNTTQRSVGYSRQGVIRGSERSDGYSRPGAIQMSKAKDGYSQPGAIRGSDRSAGYSRSEVPFTLYNFYSPTCGFCKLFAPAWNEVAERFKDMKIIDVHAIDATKPENDNLAFYYNVSAYPTIILVTPNKNIEYAGDRSANDLYNFVMRYIRAY